MSIWAGGRKREGNPANGKLQSPDITLNNEFPRLPPSTPGGEKLPRKGTREALKARRGIQSQTSTGTDTAQLRGDGSLCPPDQQFQNFLILLSYCCFFLFVCLFFYSKSIVSMGLKLFKCRLSQGYTNFQTPVSSWRGRCAGWMEYSCSAAVCNCKLLDITWLKQAGLLGQCLNELNMPGLTLCTVRSGWLCPESLCIQLFHNPFCKAFKPGYKPDLPLFCPTVLTDNSKPAEFFCLLH